MSNSLPRLATIGLSLALLTACGRVGASSHRETPFITTAPKVDATDFHRFRSYEPGCADDATVIANYVPLQGACGGPNASVRRGQRIDDVTNPTLPALLEIAPGAPGIAPPVSDEPAPLR